MVLGSRRDATATPRSALANRERDTTPRGAAGARSRVFPRADAAPALAHPDPDLDGDSDESSDNSLASTASDDTDDGGDPRRGFSDGFLRSQLPARVSRRSSTSGTRWPRRAGTRPRLEPPPPSPTAFVPSQTSPPPPSNPRRVPRGPSRPRTPADDPATTTATATAANADAEGRRPERRRPSGAAANRRVAVVSHPRESESRGVSSRGDGEGIGKNGDRKRGGRFSPSSLRSPSSRLPSAAPHARRGRRIRRVRSRRGRWWMRDAIGDVHDTRRVRERRRRGASQSDGEPLRV